MPYTITNSDGSALTTIADGTLDTTSTGLQLPGPNFVGYGQILNQNLVNLLENFASNSAPFSASQIGQLWFDKTHQVLNVFTSTGYAPVNGILVDSTQPINGLHTGTLWYNTTTDQIWVYGADGDFELIGPLYTKQQGMSGAIPTVVGDANVLGGTHNIVQMQFGNLVIGTFSTDAAFVPTPAIAGFPVVNPGLTISNNLLAGMTQFYTNANVAAYLPSDPTIAGINANLITANTTMTNYVIAQDVIINNAIISNIASMNSNIATANAAVVAYVNTQDAIINSAIIANIAGVNANIVTANNAVVSYVNTQIATTGNLWTANAASQEGKIAAVNANVTALLSTVGNIQTNVTTMQTQVYANANVAAYLPIYSGNIASGNTTVSGTMSSGNVSAGNLTVGNATVGNATIAAATVGNLTVTGRINGALQTVSLAAATSVPAAIFTTPTFCSFCLVNGQDGTGNVFSDVVLMSQGNATVNVISSMNANGTPASRSYSATSANLRLAVSSGTYTVKTVVISL